MKNNRLFLLFLVLLLMVATVGYFDSSSGDSNFDGTIVKFDSALVSKIVVASPGSKNEILLTKDEGTWMVRSGDRSYRVDSSLVPSVLSRFAKLKADRLVARGQSKWQEYELTDSLATRVTFYESDDVATDLMLGKFSYTRSQSASQNGNGGFLVTTFVRENGDERVVAVSGFLKSAFPARPDDYRNRKLARIDKQSVIGVEFGYPADSSYRLQKTGNDWQMGQTKADSASVARYLGGLSYLSGQEFLNDFVAPATGSAPYAVTVSLSDSSRVVFQAWPTTVPKQFAVGSSLAGDGIWFNGEAGALFSKIFEREVVFHPKPPKK